MSSWLEQHPKTAEVEGLEPIQDSVPEAEDAIPIEEPPLETSQDIEQGPGVLRALTETLRARLRDHRSTDN
jgi:hypothetical protein